MRTMAKLNDQAAHVGAWRDRQRQQDQALQKIETDDTDGYVIYGLRPGPLGNWIMEEPGHPFIECREIRAFDPYRRCWYDADGRLHRDDIDDPDEIAARKEHGRELIDSCDWASVRDGRLVMFWFKEPGQKYGGELKKLGLQFVVGQKTPKREKLVNFYALVCDFAPKDFVVRVLDPHRDERGLLLLNRIIREEPDAGRREKLLDGAVGIISEQALAKCLTQFKPFATAERTQDVKERLQHARVFSFRAALPTEALRLKSRPDGGMPKGHLLVCKNGTMPDGVDLVLLHSCNIKKEVHKTGTIRLGLNPQSEKGEAHTNLQYLLGLWQSVLTPKYVKQLVSRRLHHLWYSIQNNTVFESYAKIVEARERADHRKQDAEGSNDDAMARYNFVGFTFAKYGVPITSVPQLRDNLIWSCCNRLLGTRKKEWDDESGHHECEVPTDRLSVEVPWSQYAQIFSNMVARLAGYAVHVQKGEIFWLEALHAFIVNDDDWIEMIDCHGGCDQDDYFSVLRVRAASDGQTYAVVLRSPHDIGDWSVLKPMNWPQKEVWTYEWDEATQRVVRRPLEVPVVDLRKLPPRSNTVSWERAIEGFGENPMPLKSTICDRNYTKEVWDFACRGTRPGFVINAMMLTTLVLNKMRRRGVGSMEEVIDNLVQGCNPDDGAAAMQWAESVVRHVRQQQVVVDRIFAQTRFKSALRPWPLDDGSWLPALRTSETWLSELIGWAGKEMARVSAAIIQHCPFEMPKCLLAPGRWYDRPEVVKQDVADMTSLAEQFAAIRPGQRPGWMVHAERVAAERGIVLDKDDSNARMSIVKEEMFKFVAYRAEMGDGLFTERELARFHIFAKNLMSKVHPKKGAGGYGWLLLSDPTDDGPGLWSLYKELMRRWWQASQKK